MARASQPTARHSSRSNRRTRRAPAMAGVICFGLVLAAAALLLNRAPASRATSTPADEQVAQQPSPASGDQSTSASQLENKAAAQAEHATGASTIASDVARSGLRANAESSTPAGRDEPVAGRDLVAAQLAAGEFGPAIDTATSVADPAERSALLQLVADAQSDAGEHASAGGTIRRIPIDEQRNQAHARRAAKQTLAGGSGADYDELIEHITTLTSGPWESVTGEGAPDPLPYDNGVRVDPNGLLYQLTKVDHSQRLKALGIRARQADLNADVAQKSTLRLVSLTRLEKELARRMAEAEPITETMKHLAGLAKIEHVFVSPDNGEIIIGGPAEAWKFNEHGIPVGETTNRPTLQLDDFVTVLRTFSPGGAGLFRCSINPRQEGLRKTRAQVEATNASGGLTRGTATRWTEKLQNELGLQDIVINGVPADSRVARVIVEADYRMKMIGIDALDSGVGIPSYFDLLPADMQKGNADLAAMRWWLTMKYDAILASPDRNVFSIEGSSVLCQSEDELIAADGQQIHTGKATLPNQLFAENFTKNYSLLADHDPIFADLQNIFDLALVAALIRHEGLDERIGWDHGVLSQQGDYRPRSWAPPQTVMSVVNHRVYNGRDIVAQVAGGVRGDLMAVVNNDKVLRESPRAADAAGRAHLNAIPEGRWWWDAPAK